MLWSGALKTPILLQAFKVTHIRMRFDSACVWGNEGTDCEGKEKRYEENIMGFKLKYEKYHLLL